MKCFFCDWGFTIWLSHTIGNGSWSILNGRVSYLRVGHRFEGEILSIKCLNFKFL